MEKHDNTVKLACILSNMNWDEWLNESVWWDMSEDFARQMAIELLFALIHCPHVLQQVCIIIDM